MYLWLESFWWHLIRLAKVSFVNLGTFLHSQSFHRVFPWVALLQSLVEFDLLHFFLVLDLQVLRHKVLLVQLCVLDGRVGFLGLRRVTWGRRRILILLQADWFVNSSFNLAGFHGW